MTTWTLKKFDQLTTQELYAVLRLRSEVFVVEQNCVFLDMDNKDKYCHHLMGWQRLSITGESAGPVGAKGQHDAGKKANDDAKGQHDDVKGQHDAGTGLPDAAAGPHDDPARAPGAPLVGYSRIVPAGISYAESSIGRIVTSPAARRLGVGRELMIQSIGALYTLYGKRDIRIGAQYYLLHFYNSFGFVQKGEIYLEDGIEHIEMLLTAGE
jgi:ElaA protein